MYLKFLIHLASEEVDYLILAQHEERMQRRRLKTVHLSNTTGIYQHTVRGV